MGWKESKLSDYCRWNEPDSVIQFLKKERDIDLTDDDGIYFRLAVKYKSPKMLNALVEYFEQTKLQGDTNSIEYKAALHTLRKMLQQAVDMWESSPEIEEILDKYILEDDDSDDEIELTELVHSSGRDYPHAYGNIRDKGREILRILERSKDNPYLKELQIKKITLPDDLSNIQKVHKTLKTFLHILHNVEMALGELVEEKHKLSSAETSLLLLNHLSQRCQEDLTSFLKDIETQSPYLLDYDSDDDFHEDLKEDLCKYDQYSEQCKNLYDIYEEGADSFQKEIDKQKDLLGITSDLEGT